VALIARHALRGVARPGRECGVVRDRAPSVGGDPFWARPSRDFC
jgi:hypothetical protein